MNLKTAFEMFTKVNVNVEMSCNCQLMKALSSKMMSDSIRWICKEIGHECSAGWLCGGKCANALRK